jgi:hypothetical protein
MTRGGMLMLLQHGTGNFWIDNGLVVLSRLLTNGNLPAHLNPLLQQLLAGDKLPADVNPLLQQLAEQEAHRLQLLYYLYLLRERGLNLKGVLSYPEQNRREIVELDDQGLQTLQQALEALQQLRTSPLPPQVPRPMTICRTCAYQELCWCEEEETP